MLRQGIERAVEGVLHRRLGEIGGRPAVLAHSRLDVDLGMDGVARGELHPHLGQLELGIGGERGDGARGVPHEHLLHADGERDVGRSRGHLQPRAAQRGGRAGARVLDIRDRHADDPRVLQCDLAADPLLPRQEPAERVPHPGGLHVARRRACVLEGRGDGGVGQRLERLLHEAAGRMCPDANDDDVTHERPPGRGHICG